MKAGIDYIRRNAVDRTGGGMFTMLDLGNNTWGPRREFRNPQELGYGLLGLAMYYYLTRDDQVLPDILAIKKYVALQLLQSDAGNHAVDARKQRLPAIRPEATGGRPGPDEYVSGSAHADPARAPTDEWQQTLALLARSMLGTFYSPGDNLFFTSANTPQDRDLAFSGVDFGHTSKALWMLRWTGLMLGDQGMVSFSEAAGRRLFDRAYLPEDGSWAQAVLRRRPDR